ncbi:MAG: hypothetical protein SPL80_01880 [Bacilli bacterium]|nr:hypothetical protein [Bacilli bacterium]
MAEKKIKWRFPGNGGTKKNGLDTSDFHTFMADRLASAARELCQNSNDALRPEMAEKKKPVIIDIHLFEMRTSSIPGYSELLDELNRCREYWDKASGGEGARFQQMIEIMQSERIPCLRVSDFSTTGLNGVLDFEDEDSPWYSLLHGSGESGKGVDEGGSKGVGKYATFVNSSVRTVFYATYAQKGQQKGYQGIAYLASSRVKDSPTNELTQGIGYFGIDEKNNPIEGELHLDPDFKQRAGENYGTDIYILGFKGGDNWKNVMLAKILDSFMAAIASGRLEIRIEGRVVDKNNYARVAVEFASGTHDYLSRSVVSQSVLLSRGEGVHYQAIPIDFDGDTFATVDLYYKRFTGDEQVFATNNCALVRHPLMKIKDAKNIVSNTLNVSALCVIPKGKLATLLKKAENPAHNDWEWQRIEDSELREQAETLYKQLIKKIKDAISDALCSPETTRMDAEGASEYLPEKSDESNQKPTDHPAKIIDKPLMSGVKRERTSEIKTYEDDPDGNGVGMEIGEKAELQLEEFLHPDGHNESSGSGMIPGDQQESGKKNNDGSERFARNKMVGVKYRFFCRDKSAGLYELAFYAPETEDQVELELAMLDAGGQRTDLPIEAAQRFGNKLVVKKKRTIQFSMKDHELVSIQIKTPQKGLFSVEVRLYALR